MKTLLSLSIASACLLEDVTAQTLYHDLLNAPWVANPVRLGAFTTVFTAFPSPTFDEWANLLAQGGARLACFPTPAEGSLIVPQLMTYAGMRVVGLSRATIADPWTWETGDLLAYAPTWAPENPTGDVAWISFNPSTNQVTYHRNFRSNFVSEAAAVEIDNFIDCDLDGEHDPLQLLLYPEDDRDGNGVLDACEAIGSVYCASTNNNSSGALGKASILGSANVAADDVTLLAYDLPPNIFGYWLMSRWQSSIPLPGGSLGTLCLSSPIIRVNEFPYGVVATPAPPAPAVIVVEFSPASSVPQVGSLHPGETWNFQFWHRDVIPTSGMLTSNTTEAVSVLFQ